MIYMKQTKSNVEPPDIPRHPHTPVMDILTRTCWWPVLYNKYIWKWLNITANSFCILSTHVLQYDVLYFQKSHHESTDDFKDMYIDESHIFSSSCVESKLRLLVNIYNNYTFRCTFIMAKAGLCRKSIRIKFEGKICSHYTPVQRSWRGGWVYTGLFGRWNMYIPIISCWG